MAVRLLVPNEYETTTFSDMVSSRTSRNEILNLMFEEEMSSVGEVEFAATIIGNVPKNGNINTVKGNLKKAENYFDHSWLLKNFRNKSKFHSHNFHFCYNHLDML